MAYINGKEILFSAKLEGVDHAEYGQLKTDFAAVVQGDSVEITIPEGVTIIREYMFYRHPMTGINVPASVTKIDRSAFHTCTNCLVYDFTNHTTVPVLDNANVFTSINGSAKIKVPTALYSEWITATNWATIASYIYRKPSPDEVIYTPNSDANYTATVGVAVHDTFYFGFGGLLISGKRYVDYTYMFTEQDGSETERTETYELTDTGAVDGGGNALVTLSGGWYSDTYTANGVEITGSYFTGNTVFAKAGTYRIYQKFIDEAGDEYSTAAYVYEVK